jgi:RNA polymerase sigma-70 factor (ECF subfamily)
MSDVKYNEKVLIQKTLQGDERAFEELIRQNQLIIFRHCLSIVKDEEAAKDLSQETFLHAFQNISSFRMEARFSTWLWRIAHNLSLNYLKKQRPLEQQFRDELLLYNKDTNPKDINTETIWRIREATKQLSNKHRIVFEKYHFEKIPQKQIAAQLGITYGTVRSRLFYARKKIKKLLEEA